MVHDDCQHRAIGGQVKEDKAPEWPVGEVKAPRLLLLNAFLHLGHLLFRRRGSEINLCERHRLRRANLLAGYAIDHRIGRAQNLVARHQRRETLL